MRLAPALFATLAACDGAATATDDGLVVTDTDTDEPHILPIDTSTFIPRDTGPEATNDVVPENWVYLFQQGQWLLGSYAPPYGSLSGTLRIQEYVDTLDTANPDFECNVRYSLTGTEVGGHTCPTCAYVMDVEHYVTSGDPTSCHDPDAPQNGAIWQMGYDPAGDILFNYYGTDVWLPWYDATQVGATVDFSWSMTLAIEVEDSGTDG